MKINRIFLSIISIFLFSAYSVNYVQGSSNEMCNNEEFAAHKLNYLVNSSSNYKKGDEDIKELKFQFSARKSFKIPNATDRSNNATDRSNNVFLAYTQKSFWQFFRKNDSRPFRENNYNPEVFYRYCPKNYEFFSDNSGSNLKMLAIDIGIEHESNGGDSNNSYGWTRYYLIHHWKLFGKFDLAIKHWDRLKIEDENDKHIGYNELNKFHGYNEVNLKCKGCISGYDEIRFEIMGRYDFLKKIGGTEVNLIFENFPYGTDYSLADLFNIYIQYWNGYGESLERYNKNQTRFSIGASYAGL